MTETEVVRTNVHKNDAEINAKEVSNLEIPLHLVASWLHLSINGQWTSPAQTLKSNCPLS